MSAHYVVKLKPERAALLEWASFKELRAEIQIRTVTPPPVELYPRLFGNRTIGGDWLATPGFLVCLLLVAEFIEHFDVEDLQDWDWSKDTSERVIKSAKELRAAKG